MKQMFLHLAIVCGLMGCSSPNQTQKKEQAVTPDETARQTEPLADRSEVENLSEQVSATAVCDQIKSFDERAIQKTVDELTEASQREALKEALNSGEHPGFVYYFEMDQIIDLSNNTKLHLQCAKYQVTQNSRGGKEFNLSLFSRRRNFDDHFALPVLTIYGLRGFKSDQLPESGETVDLKRENDSDFPYENAQFFDGEHKIQYFGKGSVEYKEIPAKSNNEVNIALDLEFIPDDDTFDEGYRKFSIKTSIIGEGRVLNFDFLD